MTDPYAAARRRDPDGHRNTCLVCTDGLDCPDLQAALTDTGDLLELLEDDD